MQRDLRILVPYVLCLALVAVSSARSFLRAPPAEPLQAELRHALDENAARASGRNAEGEPVELEARFDSLASRVVLDWTLPGPDGERTSRSLDVDLDFYPTALACLDVNTLVVAGRGRKPGVLERWDLVPPASTVSGVLPPERVSLARQIVSRIGPVQHIFPVHKTTVPVRFAAQSSVYLSLREVLVFGSKKRELTRVVLDGEGRWIGVVAGTRAWPGSRCVPELEKPFARFEQSVGADGASLYAFLAPERDEVLVLADPEGDALFEGALDSARIVSLADWSRLKGAARGRAFHSPGPLNPPRSPFPSSAAERE